MYSSPQYHFFGTYGGRGGGRGGRGGKGGKGGKGVGGASKKKLKIKLESHKI